MKTDEQLVDYFQSNTLEAMEEGIELFRILSNSILSEKKSKKHYIFSVPAGNGKMLCAVALNILESYVDDDCSCKDFKTDSICEHCVAASLYLLNKEYGYTIEDFEALRDSDSLEEDYEIMKHARMRQARPEIQDSPEKHVVEKLDNPQSTSWKSVVVKGLMNQGIIQKRAGNSWSSWQNFLKLTLVSFDAGTRHWIFTYEQSKKSVFSPEIRYDGKDTYEYRCNCTEKRYEACEHVRSAFDKLVQENGPAYFLTFKDWTENKNMLLAPYGLSVENEEAKHFKFSLTYNGELQMQPPAYYFKAGDETSFKALHAMIKANGNEAGVLRPIFASDTIIDFEIGYVINLASQRLKLGFEIEAAKIVQQKGKKEARKLSINQPNNLPLFRQMDNAEYAALLSLSDTQLLEYLAGLGHGYVNNYSSHWQQMTGTTLKILLERYVNCLQKLWPFMAERDVFALEEGKFSAANCKPVQVSKEPFSLSFEVTADDRWMTVKFVPLVNGEKISTDEMTIIAGFLLKRHNTFHIISNTKDMPLLARFNAGFLKFPASARIETLRNVLLPLQERYVVDFQSAVAVQKVSIIPQPRVLLKESNNQHLILQPQFLYEEFTVNYDRLAEDVVVTQPDGGLMVIKRDTKTENQFFESLRTLHNGFAAQRQNDFYFVHLNDVMKGNWFINTVRRLQEENITVLGIQELKRLKYNTNNPVWKMQTGSGIDWFDLQVTISFGEQKASLRDVRKALISKQNIVVLGDGTFGVLPEEWIAQYGMLLKMGQEQKDGTLRISKLHYTLIDQLHQQIDNDEILKDIELKKQKLRDIEKVQTVMQSTSINAELRPYQLSGFQWLQTLDEMGWGGCLADDMGLGKTLQAIVFLQHLKEKNPGGTHLVVCPTSLIFNWENEIKKFAPGFRYHIYYGAGREFTDEHFENYDIVLTSYGLVRIDVEQLLRFQWHYVILDESQAIKNPDAQITKSVQLLKCKNRLILSGTPVQNNTFDLYAQFNFLNPGLLGSKDFYKSEFATPIDKYNDAEKSRQLKQLVFPFLLRRTKEQVANDLPDKTETILWCQLPNEQRAVYEEYKNYYRVMLMKKIEEDGMAKAGMYVLEGLLRLRQICDSPALLKDPEVTTTQSIKSEELLREIEENTGGHKLLVFSQFTEMLHIIENSLRKNGITYCYLDGQTPAEKRKEQVNLFQDSPAVKVFLISLKAGGVGLNLTAADYVYIIDPWWNPAAEQQAIDRTHRIGQTRKIFAYKMICKDTVEEKILELQQHKKQLANDLVTEDAGFIKKLTKDDVAFFSAKTS